MKSEIAIQLNWILFKSNLLNYLKYANSANPELTFQIRNLIF